MENDQYSAIPYIHTLFENQVQCTPQAVAVRTEERQLTYVELNTHADRLAAYLQNLGVGPDTFVGLCIDRSLEQIIAILAILKAGGAYVPLDPTYPQTRLATLVSDARLAVVVTLERYRNLFPDQVRKVYLDSSVEEEIHSAAEHGPNQLSPHHAAYMIYTSGTTGRPKGVIVPHHALTHYVQSASHHYLPLTSQDRVLQFASINFDASIEELFPCLIQGATLVLRTEAVLGSIPSLLRYCDRWAITTLSLPTAYWHEMTRELISESLELPASLRRVIIGGEQVQGELVQAWLRATQKHQVTLVNTYGPTETTVVAMFCDLTHLREPEQSPRGTIPLGQALADTQLYVLDEHGQPVSPGTVGELYIGGESVARGYHQRPEITAERFIPHPFTSRPGARLYKTGDLVSQRPDGLYTFQGRSDQQVKIRGFRVEPGEIAYTLLQHPAIRQAIVLARPANETAQAEVQLFAFVQPRAGTPLNTTEVSRYVREHLPRYMHPGGIVILDEFPFLPNGKIDTQALLRMPRTTTARAIPFVAPSTVTERELAAIWSTILGIDTVSVNDNFFELGGHSLAATRLLSLLRRTFHCELSLQDVFHHPTIAELARMIDTRIPDQSNAQSESIPRLERDGDFPLSFSQERIWFIQQLYPEILSYNTQTVHHFQGELRIQILEQSIQVLIERHEILRTTFHNVQGSPVQRFHPSYRSALPLIDLSDLPADVREAQAQRIVREELSRPFDVSRLPLLRWTLIRRSEQEHILILVEHHLIHDGWSANVLLRDLLASYRAFSQGVEPQLPQLPIQFADFASWQRQWMKGEQAQNQLAYWKRQLADSPPRLMRPDPDAQRHADTQVFAGTSLRTTLPVELAEALRRLSKREGTTLFMTMLAAFFVLLARYSGQQDLNVGTGIANRRWPETENLIGMIINNVVLRSHVSHDFSFHDLLQRIKTTTLEAYDNQDVPFDHVVNAVQPVRDINSNPLFQVMFSFHDPPMPDLTLPHLSLRMDEAVSNGFAKFDLDVLVIPRAEQYLGQQVASDADEMTLIWEYNTTLLDAPAMPGLMEEYLRLLEHVVADPEQPISSLELSTRPEREQNDSAGHPGQNTTHQDDVQPFVAPRTALEEVLVSIWRQLLNVASISIHDNFFELGGHSLLLTRMNSRLLKIFQVELPLRSFFDAPTVAGQAELLRLEETVPGRMEAIAQVWRKVATLSAEEIRTLRQSNT